MEAVAAAVVVEAVAVLPPLLPFLLRDFSEAAAVVEATSEVDSMEEEAEEAVVADSAEVSPSTDSQSCAAHNA